VLGFYLVLGCLAGGVYGDEHAADPSDIYATWDDWKSAYDELVEAIAAFKAVGEKPIDGPARLLEAVQARDRVYHTALDVEGYIYVRLELNGGDDEALSRQHLLDETDSLWYGASGWFTPALEALGREKVEEWIEQDDSLKVYSFYFRRYFDGTGHRIPQDEGKLRALLSVSGSANSRMYRALSVTEAPAVTVILESGEELELSPARAKTVLWELASGEDRMRASRAWLEAMGKRSETYASLLSGVVGRQKIRAEASGFDSPLAAELHSDAIPEAAVRNAIAAAKAVAPAVRRYHELRGKAFGLESYRMSDRFAPVRADETKISYDEARSIIVGASAALGEGVREVVRRAFDDGWIDAVERTGKRQHGGSTDLYVNHPFVLVSYRGSLDSLFQLAHEIGHAVHADFARKSQPFVYGHRSTLTSEAAASVFENAVVDFMVKQAKSDDERVRVLDLAIQNSLRIFFRPMTDADFELRLYDTKQAMTGKALGELYLSIVQDLYGASVRVEPWDANAWQLTPHYYTSPLYLGRYGLSSAAADLMWRRLSAEAEGERKSAQESFVELLRAGGSDYPFELLRRAGADLNDTSSIEPMVERLDSLVSELERVAEASASGSGK